MHLRLEPGLTTMVAMGYELPMTVTTKTNKAPNQLEFLAQGLKKPGRSFGGSLLKGNNPKCSRPLESKLPIHLVLRATQGGMRKPKVFGAIAQIVDRAAKRHGVKIYTRANVGNHLHLLIKLSRVKLWAGFIREVSGGVAQLMKDLQLAPRGQKFWLHRPFTRIVDGWKKAYEAIKGYIYLNQLEADGHISRKETKTLKDLRFIWSDG